MPDPLNEFYEEYVMNEIPTRLLYVKDLDNIRLMERGDVKAHFESTIKNIQLTNDDINPNNPDREKIIRDVVMSKVKYAIFSHRWGNYEPTFQYLEDPKTMPEKVRDGPGYSKLKNFCSEAHEHGCDFAWSDTCCINKKDPGEVDENIRSMFRYYRNAHICIAYLGDTTGHSDVLQDMWFTRGWTLQELIAPSRLKFYTKEWRVLNPGSRNDKEPGTKLLDSISEITRIPVDDLIAFRPGTDRVSEKMAWYADRRTTRIEDVAYCLIGIFDVSLMVAYGEGRRAFYRLMEAIFQRYDKWDIFAWKGQCSAYNAAIPSHPSCYPPWATPHQRKLLRPGEKADDTAKEYDHEYEVGYRLFALTNSGMRTKLLLVTVDLLETGETSEGLQTMTFSQASGEIENVVVTCKRIPARAMQEGAEWALGILDSWLNEGQGFIDTYREFTAILLSWNDGLRQYEKEMTENVLTVRVLKAHQDDLRELYL